MRSKEMKMKDKAICFLKPVSVSDTRGMITLTTWIITQTLWLRLGKVSNTYTLLCLREQRNDW